MAQRGGDLAGLVEGGELLVQRRGVLEGEHRRLPSGDDQGVVGVDVEVGHRPRAAQLLAERRVVLVAARDLVLGLPLRRVVGIAHRVPLAGAAVG